MNTTHRPTRTDTAESIERIYGILTEGQDSWVESWDLTKRVDASQQMVSEGFHLLEKRGQVERRDGKVRITAR